MSQRWQDKRKICFSRRRRTGSHHELYRTCSEVCNFSSLRMFLVFVVMRLRFCYHWRWIFHVKVLWVFSPLWGFADTRRARSFPGLQLEMRSKVIFRESESFAGTVSTDSRWIAKRFFIRKDKAKVRDGFVVTRKARKDARKRRRISNKNINQTSESSRGNYF